MNIIIFRKIKHSLSEADATYCGSTTDEIEKLINQYFYGLDERAHFQNIEENDFLAVSTLLDPRFKTVVC